MKLKTCTACGTDKPLSDYFKDKTKKDGLSSGCKDCKKAQTRKYLATDKGRATARKCDREWKRSENGQKCRRRYNEKYRERRNKRMRDRRKNNPVFKLRHFVSTRVRRHLTESKGHRTTFDDILPYTPKQLKAHLNKTMPSGFTWRDYLNGDLHLDHIDPIAALKPTKINSENFRHCWSLDNLQLLPARENISKGCKPIRHIQLGLT